MNKIPIQTAIEKAQVASDAAYLLFLEIFVPDPQTNEILETVRLVNNSEDLNMNGQVYYAIAFDLSIKAEAGGLPSVSLTIQDPKGIVRSYMEQYGGGIDFEVVVHAAFSNALDMPPDASEYFVVTASSAPGYVANFTLGAENPLTRPFPRRRMRRDYCAWRYKDKRCGYTGPLPTCDYSLQGTNGCAVHGNTLRFGGAPGINNSGISYGRG